MIDALINSDQRARGVAIVNADIQESELKEMHQAGVRAVRFNFVKRLVDPKPPEVYLKIAEKIKKLGWHVVVYFEAADFEELRPPLLEFKTIIVIDHMGRPDIAKGVHHNQFQQYLQFIPENNNIWVKVSGAERVSLTGPKGYKDVIPFAKLLVEKYQDRVFWGSDWPHPNMKSHMPDDGNLVDFIPKIAPDKHLQQALLVDNPMRLYWPDP